MINHLSIDEVTLSQGEIYTILTNKKFKNKKNYLVAIVARIKAHQVIKQICKIDYKKKSFKEITIDMIKLISKKFFPKAIQITNRFLLQKLALKALQETRIKHRCESMDFENQLLLQAKSENKTYIPQLLPKEDFAKQLLVSNRFFPCKFNKKRTQSQNKRAQMLFELLQHTKTSYNLNQQLRGIYNNDKHSAMTKHLHRHKNVEESFFKNFNILLITTTINYQSILNYFDNISTNAFA